MRFNNLSKILVSLRKSLTLCTTHENHLNKSKKGMNNLILLMRVFAPKSELLKDRVS